MKALKPFAEYVLGVYYSGVDKYGNQIEVSKESFEKDGIEPEKSY